MQSEGRSRGCEAQVFPSRNQDAAEFTTSEHLALRDVQSADGETGENIFRRRTSLPCGAKQLYKYFSQRASSEPLAAPNPSIAELMAYFRNAKRRGSSFLARSLMWIEVLNDDAFARHRRRPERAVSRHAASFVGAVNFFPVFQ